MKISNFRNRLKEMMANKGISVTELSNKTGISKPSIVAYRNGDYEPKQDKLELIALALGVTPVWLKGYDVSQTERPKEYRMGTVKNSDGSVSLKAFPIYSSEHANVPTDSTNEPNTNYSRILMRAQEELSPEDFEQVENMAKYFLEKKHKEDK